MKLSKRELNILIVTVAVIVGWLGYEYIWSPFMARRAELQSQVADAQTKYSQAKYLITQSHEAQKSWRVMLKSGLQADASTAESQIIHAVHDWAQSAGLNLSIKPERQEQDKIFKKMAFRATGTGNLSSITYFVWQVRQSTIPARITDIQLTARKDGTDDLSLSVGISTLALAEPKAAAIPSNQSAKEVQ